MIKCLAIDDETPALDILEDNIRQVPFLQLIGKCKSAYLAMEVLQKESIDLLFLDIEMPGINGLSFLRGLSNKPMVIFITAYRDYAAEGFDLNVLDYLVKPVAFDRFLRAATKALDYQKYRQMELMPPNTQMEVSDYLFVHTEYQLTKIFIHEILYIEGSRNYIRIHLTVTSNPIICRLSLRTIEDKLPPRKYARIHKSFIVMIDKIDSIRNDCIRIGKTELSVSRSYREEFFGLINERNIREE